MKRLGIGSQFENFEKTQAKRQLCHGLILQNAPQKIKQMDDSMQKYLTKNPQNQLCTLNFPQNTSENVIYEIPPLDTLIYKFSLGSESNSQAISQVISQSNSNLGSPKLKIRAFSDFENE